MWIAAAVVVLVATSAVGAVVVADETPRRDASQFLPERSELLSAEPSSEAGESGSTDDGDREVVRVGIIGSQFAADHPSLSGRVGSRARIGGSPALLRSGGGSLHDTAVAEIVAERSPSATLYLVGIGSRPTATRYTSAVDWLLDREVDVIVDAGSYLPRTGRGLDRFESAAGRAATAGTVFVTSAGNYAQRHWRGRGDGTGWVSFGPTATRNYLGGTANRTNDSPASAIRGPVTLRLYWTGEADYDLYLYREVSDGPDQIVASSIRRNGTAEAIDTVVTEGDYYVRVYNREGSAPVDLFAATHSLSHTSPGGSALPPATARGVISVGALGAGGRARPYTSAGGDVSVPDGIETDVAGRFRGTSAAAPVVAGTVSSMVARTGGRALSPGEIARILRETADGRQNRLDPDAALARVDNETTDISSGGEPPGRLARTTSDAGVDGMTDDEAGDTGVSEETNNETSDTGVSEETNNETSDTGVSEETNNETSDAGVSGITVSETSDSREITSSEARDGRAITSSETNGGRRVTDRRVDETVRGWP